MSESAGPMAPIGGGEFMPQSSFASLRNRFGISTKLQVAFCAAGAMSLLAGVVAIGSFSASETEFHRVTGTQVPLMVQALQLSASVGEYLPKPQDSSARPILKTNAGLQR